MKIYILLLFFQEYMLDILLDDSTNSIRSEAAIAVSVMAEEMVFETETMTKWYWVMSQSVTKDRHAGVRRNALQFWSGVIEKHLLAQGMTDNAFPEATFSKELKKIVILNEMEIKSRLAKVLCQLSANGCLAVLVDASRDADHTVCEEVRKILRNLVNLLKNYQFSINDLHRCCHVKSKTANNRMILECDETDVQQLPILTPKEFLISATKFLDTCNDTVSAPTDGIETILEELVTSSNSTKIATESEKNEVVKKFLKQ